jgi:hypothetical protein
VGSGTCPVQTQFSVADPHHFDADPDPTIPFTLMRIRVQILLKQTHTGKLYILACHLQIDADPGSQIQIQLITLMRIRILPFN